MPILIPGQELPPSETHPLFARSGWRIPTSFVQELDIREVRIKANELMSWRRGLSLRSVSSHPYNCVGLVFANRRAWIDIDHIYDILKEDGYRQIALNQVMEGDVVVYRYQGDPSHVALVITVDRSIGTSIRVLSKWGKDAEFLHFMENVPERLGTPAEFYTERKA